MGRLDITLADLSKAAETNDAVLLSYSGGKDSLACADLCFRTFKRVEMFFMYFIPGLECCEVFLREAEARWGVKVRQYPHWITARNLKYGHFCFHDPAMEELQELKLGQIYELAMAETGIPLIAMGGKKADSLWRRRQLKVNSWYKELLLPLKEWSKLDVIAYLKARGLPVPMAESKSAAINGISLVTPSVLWMHDNFPDDYKKLLEWFPFAEAIVKRREWYGIQ